MATSLLYLPSYKNVDKLFNGISSAKIPDAFSHKFLADTLGIKGTGDRPLIPFLRSLGFLDGSNKPTSSYAQLKNPALKKKAIAKAIRHAYNPIFEADENAERLTSEQLKGLISQVSGADSSTVSKTMGTLNALLKLAEGGFDSSDDKNEVNIPSEVEGEKGIKKPQLDATSKNEFTKITTPFHFNIQVHLPSNASEETYLNIFNAVRKVFS